MNHWVCSIINRHSVCILKKYHVYGFYFVGSENSIDENVIDEPTVKKSTDDKSGVPKESQMAQCTVTSGDIKASAQATFSRKIEGDFCQTSELLLIRNSSNFLGKLFCRGHG